jgi:hypothetical protein
MSLAASQALGLQVTFGLHEQGPHAEDVNPNPNRLILSLFGVVPGAGSASGSQRVAHPTTSAGNHFDWLTVSINPVSDTQSHINVSAVHVVPEAGSVTLALAGASLLFLSRRRLRRG